MTPPDVPLGRDELLALYEGMALIRRTEKAAHDLFLSGLVKGTTHLAAGHERSPSARARRCVPTTTSSPPTEATTTPWPAARPPRSASPNS
jgi:hypothetical protein